LFLIGFRVFAPGAIRWIVRRRSSGVFDTRLTPEQILIAAGALWLLLFVIGIARMGGDVMGAVFPLDGRGGATMWGRGAVESSASGFLISFAGYLFNAVTAFLGVLVFFQRSIAWRLLAAFYPDISVLWTSSADPKTGHSGDCVLLLKRGFQVCDRVSWRWLQRGVGQ